MKLIDESDLRAQKIPGDAKEYRVPEGSILTPLAKEYLASRKIVLTYGKKPEAKNTMTIVPIPKKGPARYIDAATGESLREKPENMTHIGGNLLVPKTHPRIEFRGRLDSLEAKILELQVLAQKAAKPALIADLQDALLFVRNILAAEVKNAAFPEGALFGMTEEALHKVSHDVKSEFGFEHPVPSYEMGETAVGLNSLRTQVRECELSAARAFGNGRTDLVRALNRLSSGIYILFCRELAGRYC